MTLSQLKTEVEDYPATDGEPMAETGFHVTLIVCFLVMLRSFFRDRGDVYVGANMFMYYRQLLAKRPKPKLLACGLNLSGCGAATANNNHIQDT